MTQWNHLTSIMRIYEEASGQKMNLNKTAIFFNRNTPEEEKT
jgi:hypothetical protein